MKLAEVCMNIPIEPVPKLRPRFTVKYGRVYTHTPLRTKIFENQIAQYYIAQSKAFKFDKGVPLEVDLWFGLPVPKSFTKKKCRMIESGELWHTVKPDCDNLCKAVLDALNDVAWHDDAQIASLKVHKGYSSDGAYINLRISELG